LSALPTDILKAKTCRVRGHILNNDSRGFAVGATSIVTHLKYLNYDNYKSGFFHKRDISKLEVESTMISPKGTPDIMIHHRGYFSSPINTAETLTCVLDDIYL
jgi:hypothetical protein